MDCHSLLFQRYLTDFLNTYKSLGTRRIYKTEILAFARWYNSDLKKISKKILTAYTHHCKTLKTATIERKFVILNNFFKYLTKIQSLKIKNPIKNDNIKELVAVRYWQTAGYKKHLEDYLKRYRSPETKKVYENEITLFWRWAEKDPTQITRKDIGRYKETLLDLVAPSTANRKFVALNGFFTYLGIVLKNFQNPIPSIRALALPPVPKNSTYDFLTVEESKLLLNQPDRKSLIGKRDYLILRFMLIFGWRAGDITKIFFGNIKRTQENGKRGLWIPDRKWYHSTLFVLEPEDIRALDEWLIASRIRFKPASPIFVGFNSQGEINKTRMGIPITVRTVENIVNRYLEGAGFASDDSNRKLSAHALRHTAFTHMIRSGASLREAMYLAGHSTTNMMIRYAREKDQFQDNASLYNPVRL